MILTSRHRATIVACFRAYRQGLHDEPANVEYLLALLCKEPAEQRMEICRWLDAASGANASELETMDESVAERKRALSETIDHLKTVKGILNGL